MHNDVHLGLIFLMIWYGTGFPPLVLNPSHSPTSVRLLTLSQRHWCKQIDTEPTDLAVDKANISRLPTILGSIIPSKSAHPPLSLRQPVQALFVTS